jgi:hypothetical protein
VGRIEFTDADLRRRSFVCNATVAADGEEWIAALDMIAPYRSDMLGFFEEIAAEHRGWAGVKEWQSEFGELRLQVTNTGAGTAVVDAHVTPEGDEEGRVTLHVRSDELPRVANELRRFLQLDRGSRLGAPGCM